MDKLLTVHRDTSQQAVDLYAALMGSDTEQMDTVVEAHLMDRSDAVPVLVYAMGYMVALAQNLRDSSPQAAETCRALIERDQFGALTTNLQ